MGNDSRVHELQADLIALRNELKTLQSNSKTDKQSKRETFAGLTEENEQLHSDLQKVRSLIINTCISRAYVGVQKAEFAVVLNQECIQLYNLGKIIFRCFANASNRGNVAGFSPEI